MGDFLCAATTAINCAEQQLQDINQQNRILRLQLEATREAGIQALRTASQKLSETHRIQWEELKKTHQDEKQRIQVGYKEWERRMEKEEESAAMLGKLLDQRCACISAMEERVQRMEKEKKILLMKKSTLELMLQELPSTKNAMQRRPSMEQDLLSLRDQIRHLQVVIHGQHRSLRSVIGQAEELRRKLKRKDEDIEKLKGMLRGLEEQNKELKARLTARLSQSAGRVSIGVVTDQVPPIGSLKMGKSFMVLQLDSKWNHRAGKDGEATL